MTATDQGARRDRYHAIPRTLIFLTNINPQTGEQELLLLKGAPGKRLWANKYNGLGGHVEADEDIHSAALREVKEETGLGIGSLTLRGVVNIDTGSDQGGRRPGVLMFIFVGETQNRVVHTTAESTPEWIPVNKIGQHPLVDDLYEVIPRALGEGELFYAHYWPDQIGLIQYRFS